MSTNATLDSLPSLAEVVRKHGLAVKKSLGQHFLLDSNITDKVARAAGDLTQHHVLEIGPGPGGLTRSLLAAGAKQVVAIERDPRCVEALQEVVAASDGRLKLIEADALKVQTPTLLSTPRKVVANLPYNVGTQLLLNWLEEIAENPTAFTSLTLMFQKEVAERIVAMPNTKEYGRLSVFAQWLCEVHWHFDIPPGAFSPPPNVMSSVITLVPRKTRIAADQKTLEKVAAAAFNQRRKMLRASLKSLGVNTETLLADAKIDGTRRAETLSVQEFCDLANAL